MERVIAKLFLRRLSRRDLAVQAFVAVIELLGPPIRQLLQIIEFETGLSRELPFLAHRG